MKPKLFIRDEFQASDINNFRKDIIIGTMFIQDGALYCSFPISDQVVDLTLINTSRYRMSDCGYAESFPTFEFDQS